MAESTDDQLRITTAQRERAIELVRQGAADGRLEFEEMQSRVAIGLEARTQGELRQIVNDLVPSADLAAFLADVTPMLEGPGATWDNPLMLGLDRKVLTMDGPWAVPPFVELHCGIWHVVTLNFLDAKPLAPLIDLVVVGHNGSPTFIVPQGWGVDTERLSVGNQGMFSSQVATRPEKGYPRIVMRGSISGGRARYAKARELRRSERLKALGKGR